MINYIELKRCVHRKLKKSVVDSFIKFLCEKQISLWGLKKTRNWISKTAHVTLYKHLFSVGYTALLGEIKGWYDVGSRTLAKNCKTILMNSRRWSNDNVKAGTFSEWRNTTRNLNFPKSLKNVLLWMDSCDFRLSGKNFISTSDCSWSYKENSPAQRFMFVQDSKTRFRAVFGDYSPKIDDNSTLSLIRQELNTKFKYATISADCGFSTGRRLFDKITFVTPFSKKRGPKRKGVSKQLNDLTGPQKRWNKEMRTVRARVEPPYALLKNKWEALSDPFREGEELQDDLVLLAVAFHNASL